MSLSYPPARRIEAVETLFGYQVADPYRWLEDPDDPESRAWSAAEDELCRTRVGVGAGRAYLRTRLGELLPGFIGSPTVVGDRSFFFRRLPGQDHAALWVEQGGTERVLIDPSALSEDHTVTLDGWAVSNEGDRLAYLLSEGGDEESAVRVMDVDSAQVVDGPIDRARYSPIAWLPGGEALYYVRRLAPSQVPPGEEQYHRRVYLHRIGTDPAEDSLVFGEGSDRTSYFGVTTSRDGRWLSITVSLGTAPRNDCYLADLGAQADAPDQPDWHVVLEGTDAQAWPLFGPDGDLFLVTDLDAPRRKLVRVDRQHPDSSRWIDVLVEDAEGGVLDDVVLAGDTIVAVRSRHALSYVSIHDQATGAPGRQVTLPGLGSADVTGRPDGAGEVWIGYTDHVTPHRILHLDVASGLVTPWAEAPGSDGVTPAGVGAEQVSYASADGTIVRMFVIAGGSPDRPRPTILYGYGGFNVSLTPAYSSTILAWVEAGGVYAIANLRGGSEEGEAWHRDGMRERKQHVFDDVAAAAEWLVEQGWTTREQLAISGGSNGGLLVGAAITERPELYAAAVCSAPLLDMVRYERFGLGETWNDEYGTAADPTQLGWLLSYSPYHHVVPGTPYPAVLFTVFDGDSRVDPLHARKMCAALQWATSSDAATKPVLLRREGKVGHGARSVTRSIELAADELAWLAGQLGLDLGVTA